MSVARPGHLHNSRHPCLLAYHATDMTKVLRIHTVKFGGEFRKLFMNFRQHGQPSGSYSFNTAGHSSRWAPARPRRRAAASLRSSSASRQRQHRAHICHRVRQRVLRLLHSGRLEGTRKLTLNIGLRWDVDVPRTESYNRLSYFDIDAPSPIAGKVPGFENLQGAMRFATPDHRRQTPTDLNNWGPRFGFAYQFTAEDRLPRRLRANVFAAR